MHRTLTLKINLNRLSDGTDEKLIIEKVHQILEKELGAHGFTGVQKIAEEAVVEEPAEVEPASEPQAPAEASTPEEREARMNAFFNGMAEPEASTGAVVAEQAK